MARRNFPDLSVEVVQDDHGWAVWLLAIIGGAATVFGLTAVIVSFVIHG